MKLKTHLHATGGSKAVYANPPDFDEMMAWRGFLRKGDLFVDVGSNVGLYSVWAADCGALPIAVEPDPLNARLTQENLELNGIAAEVHECALANESGTMLFTSGADTLNHLVPAAGEGESNQGRVVIVRTLDEVIAGRKVRGVKIDVEGFERLVIQGAQQSLAAHSIDILQIEWNELSLNRLGEDRTPVANILRAHGYIMCELNGHERLRALPSAPTASDHDLFAVTPGALAELSRD